MISKCLLAVALLSAVRSVPVTQEEYARYISQQQIARLSDNKGAQPATARRPVLVQVLPAAYQPAAAAASPRPVAAAAAYQPQPQLYQQPQYHHTPTYQTQQEPEDYQQPEQYQPASRPQAYQPKAAPRPKPAYKTNKQQQQEDDEADNDPNAQYQFSFDISDDESTNYHNRKETRDGQKISGSYSVVDSDGFIRTVTYTADPEEGFKAEVSREPTNIQVKIPAPTQQPAAPSHQYRLAAAERKPQPQYITLPSNEQETDEQPSSGQPISGYYRQAQPLLSKPPSPHRFAAGPRPQPKAANALGYATASPAGGPIIYQAYQQ